MAAKVTIIIGMPGSGKTSFISQNDQFKNAVVIDNYHKDAVDHSERLASGKYFHLLQQAIHGSRDIVISDIIYCRKKKLDDIISELKQLASKLSVSLTIECIYFENNPQACIANVQRRNRPGRTKWELDFIGETARKYNIPPNAKVLSVYQPA